jgi:hypothetical protein
MMTRALSEIAPRVAVLRRNLSNGERPYRRPETGSSRRSRGFSPIRHRALRESEAAQCLASKHPAALPGATFWRARHAQTASSAIDSLD